MGKSVEMDVSELEQLILQQSGYIEKELPKELNVFLGEIQEKLKRGDFKNRTGDLRRSMKTALVDYDISVSMLNYGYFLSFGVDGRNRKGAFGVTSEVAAAFGVREGYKFGSSKVWGIEARKFYPTDLEETIINYLENIIENG